MSVFGGLPDVFTASLGEPVVYTRTGFDPVTINAIVIKRMTVFASDGPDQVAAKVVIHCRVLDVPNLAEGHLFAVPLDGATFNGKAVQPIASDGKGMTLVTLARA